MIALLPEQARWSYLELKLENYINIRLMVKQVCLEAIYHGCDVVAVLSTGYMKSQSYFNCGRGAAQFHIIVIIVFPLNVLDQINAKNIRMAIKNTYGIAFSKSSCSSL